MSITAWLHSCMQNSSEICKGRSLPTFLPIAVPTTFHSAFWWSRYRLQRRKRFSVFGRPSCLRRHTTIICCHLSFQTAFGMFQSSHAHSSVCRPSLQMISCVSSGRISCSPPCTSVQTHSGALVGLPLCDFRHHLLGDQLSSICGRGVYPALYGVASFFSSIDCLVVSLVDPGHAQ
jgi:hypothetical protein